MAGQCHLVAAPDPVDEADPLPPLDDEILSPLGTLETLYRRNAARLRRMFKRRAGSDDADDLLHDAFVRIASISSATPIAKPDAYLSTVAVNLLRDRARAAARQALEFHAPVDETNIIDLGLHRTLEDRDQLARLEVALERLHPRRRQIFLLHRMEHKTYADIAIEVGMSVKGVKTQMAKALFQLRRDVGPL